MTNTASAQDTSGVDYNDAAQPVEKTKTQKRCALAFNLASGFVVGGLLAKFGVAATIGAALVPVTAPALALVVVSAIATGVVSGAVLSLVSHAYDRATAAPGEKVEFSFKSMLIRMAASAVGAGIFMSIDFGSLFDKVTGAFASGVEAAPSAQAAGFVMPEAGNDAVFDAVSEVTSVAAGGPGGDVGGFDVADESVQDTAVEEVVAEEAVERPCAVAKAAELLAGRDLTPCAQEALRLAQAGNAQGMKDLGLYFLMGSDGVAANPEAAVLLMQESAALGNTQAQVDLTYLEFHGKAGFDADRVGAMRTMMGIDSDVARSFVQQWADAGVKVSDDVIVASAQAVDAPVTEIAAADVAAEAEVPCEDAIKLAVENLDGHDLTPCAQEALRLAQAGNAQGMKDLGLFYMLGSDGVPKDPAMAVRLLDNAAYLGNAQAQVDLTYLQYHGLHGVTGGKEAALETMRGLDTDAARRFVADWTGVSASKTGELSGKIFMDVFMNASGAVEIEINVGEQTLVDSQCSIRPEASDSTFVSCDVETVEKGRRTLEAVIPNMALKAA